jgi:hypothetical protein
MTQARSKPKLKKDSHLVPWDVINRATDLGTLCKETAVLVDWVSASEARDKKLTALANALDNKYAAQLRTTRGRVSQKCLAGPRTKRHLKEIWDEQECAPVRMILLKRLFLIQLSCIIDSIVRLYKDISELAEAYNQYLRENYLTESCEVPDALRSVQDHAKEMRRYLKPIRDLIAHRNGEWAASRLALLPGPGINIQELVDLFSKCYNAASSAEDWFAYGMSLHVLKPEFSRHLQLKVQSLQQPRASYAEAQVINLITEARQQFLREISGGSLLISAADPEMRARMHRFMQESMAEWKASRRCIVPDCDELAIGSHTIQERGPLKHIAEDGDVLSPRCQAAGGYTMHRTRLAAASKFPGFCSLHERLFHRFERRKRLENPSDFILQAYRATCREVVRLGIEISYCRENAEAMRDTYRRFCASEVSKRVGARGIEISTDAVLEVMGPGELDVRFEAATNDLEKLRTAHLKSMEQKIFADPGLDLPVVSLTFPVEIPVCLSGLDCFHVQAGEHHRRLLVILNVIPEQGGTHVIVFMSPEDHEFIRSYVSRFYRPLLYAIGHVEAAMLYATDHWFLRPSVWDRLPNKRQNDLLFHMLRNGSAIEWSQLTIFDEIRAMLRKEELRRITERENEWE